MIMRKTSEFLPQENIILCIFMPLFIKVFYILSLHTKMGGSKQTDIQFVPIVITGNVH